VKRLLQGLGLLQLFLFVALSVRLVKVWTTPLPEVGEIPELPAVSSLPPAKSAPTISPVVTEDVVDHDLFDEERGQGVKINPEDVKVDAAPVPPPTTVKLMGVMFIGEDPVGILLDTSVKPEQQTVRKGEMFGEYEVGDITKTGVLLLGGDKQQFQIPLHVEAAGGGAGVANAAPAQPGAAVPRTPGTPPAHPAPATRPATMRPPAGRNDNAAGDAEQKAMSARERAQAIAQRNADMRKTGQKAAPGGEAGEKGNDGGAPDPVQARLEALRPRRATATKGR
jgi:hypothetical protein